MAQRLEVLKVRPSKYDGIVDAIGRAAKEDGYKVSVTSNYQGRSEWLVLWGIGAPANNLARHLQVRRGGKCINWDLGYVARPEHYRCSINADHPQQWFDRTVVGHERWASLGVELRDTYSPDGHIVLVGMGKKSRAYLKDPLWEEKQLRSLRKRFPEKRIVFRPKGDDTTRLDCETDTSTSIQDAIKGASLIVCRHSNVAVDGILQNIPFEARDGAATWLKDLKDREQFLNRLAWWQWTTQEARTAWKFLKQVSN